MKTRIFLNGNAVSETPIDIARKTLQALRADIADLGLSLPPTWQFLKMDDALPVESERGILASLIAIDGKITIAALPNAKTSAKPARSSAKPSTASKATTPAISPRAGKQTDADSSSRSPSSQAGPNAPTTGKPAPTSSKPTSAPTSGGRGASTPPAPAASPTSTPSPANKVGKQAFVVDAPKPLEGKLEADPFKSFEELWKAALQGGEVIKSPSGTHTAFSVFDAARRRGKFPLLVMADNALSLKDDAIALRLPHDPDADSAAVNQALQASIRINVRSEDIKDAWASESLLLRDLHGSSAFKLVYSAGAEGSVDGVMVGGEDHFSYQSSNRQLTKQRERSVHVSSVRRVTKASITLPRELIHVSADIQSVFENALDTLDASANFADQRPQDPEQVFENVLRVLGSKGAMIPRTYLLGGQITIKDQMQSDQTLTSIEDEKKVTFEQEVAAEAKQAGVKVNAQTQVGNTEKKGSANSNSKQSASRRLHMIGGAAGLAESPAEWIKSLEDPTNWDIIGYDNCLPVWEFFDAPLRERWRKFANRFRQLLEAEIKKEYAKHDNLINLLKDRARLQERGPDSIRASFGIANLPGSSTAEEMPWQVSEDWKFTSLSSGQAVQLNQDEVITYISIFTAFSPPGTWEVTSGGLMESELRMSFKQESLRGMSWHVDVQRAKRSAIEIAPRFHAINALYQAMIASPK
ncbi:MAC/perforin domain-containing protein [Xanthomonas sp. WHRI 10064A]|uniref:MAC/perforin domain-containing protein n=1 Tax=unclassified Xanthomonas TaxID=2643310 RepID=UPI002B2265FC|nr:MULTISPECIES: MAC/perforin domain-containing protein [unclassified Xanthomonas]MEA9587454.1 MAC/perforin domain-containing protein [Xanthomonas sp. WHRI 10064B]MEA9615175.1 MAC/perforin domain-containing protein [Xanthomonas sp. WHRI 10064A]